MRSCGKEPAIRTGSCGCMPCTSTSRTPRPAVAFLKEGIWFLLWTQPYLSGRNLRFCGLLRQRAEILLGPLPGIHHHQVACAGEAAAPTGCRWRLPDRAAKGAVCQLEQEYGGFGGVPQPQPRYGFPKPEAPAPTVQEVLATYKRWSGTPFWRIRHTKTPAAIPTGKMPGWKETPPSNARWMPPGICSL